jgi:hypothetical protein
MPRTLTLRLEGEVTLAEYAKAIDAFQDLVKALTAEVGGKTLDWVVTGLEASSAVATVEARPHDEAERHVEDAVIRIYEETGQYLQRRQMPPFTRAVRPISILTDLINGRITSLGLETEATEAIITSKLSDRQPVGVRVLSAAYGAVDGFVETLQHHGSLRFTLYDALNGKAVSCYLDPGSEETMRDVWGKRAVVEGLVRRDPLTGRPITIRRITTVSVTQGAGAPDDSYRRARGAVPWTAGPPPEVVIRQLRDA